MTDPIDTDAVRAEFPDEHSVYECPARALECINTLCVALDAARDELDAARAREARVRE